MPTKADKEVLRPLYQRYKELKAALESSPRHADNGAAARSRSSSPTRDSSADPPIDRANSDEPSILVWTNRALFVPSLIPLLLSLETRLRQHSHQ